LSIRAVRAAVWAGCSPDRAREERSEAAAALDVAVKQTKRRQWSVELKREIVEETLAPGASVARVARAHEVNANQVFDWRRLYRQGRLGNTRQRPIRLLPVTVTEEGNRELMVATESSGTLPPPVCREPAISTPAGVIDLELSTDSIRRRCRGT
jgi:transposase